MKHLFILVSCLLIGCASRKVDVDIKKKDSTIVETKTEVVVKKTDSTSDNFVVDKSEIDELIITPIDTTKEIIVNGKKYFNAILKYKKIKNNTYTKSKIKVSKIEDKHSNSKSNTRVKSKEKTKNIRVDNTMLYVSFFLIFIVLFLIANKLKKIYL